jgi:zinc protease
VIIFTGDISAADAYKLANRFFGAWKNKLKHNETLPGATASPTTEIPATSTLKRMLVVDVPNSGQASVSYNKKVESGRSRFEVNFFPAMVGNSILGGGYSARLNQEIRIKRGLSYGAGSSFSWRYEYANFSTRCQTKNPSAAEVAELTVAEIEKLTGENGTDAEMTARKAVMTGTFGRNFETNFGVSNQIAELLSFELPFGELGTFIANTESVTADNVREFASKNLRGGDIIIVGDYAKFKDDLARRFPTTRIEVIRSTELDLNSVTLRKK